MSFRGSCKPFGADRGNRLDLTGRLFELTGTDAAAYDAYATDPVSLDVCEQVLH